LFDLLLRFEFLEGEADPKVLQCHSAHHHRNYLLASLIWNDLAAAGISAKFKFVGSFATLLDMLLLSLLLRSDLDSPILSGAFMSRKAVK
jgi:hypothetical protein